MSIFETRGFREDPSKSASGMQYGSSTEEGLNFTIDSTHSASTESDDVARNDTKTLNIINEFKKLYEEKMKIIDADGDGDCNIRAKISLQQDWIRDLTEQNEMLVRAVEELEQEATERVLSLEEKLKQTSKCACEVMNGYKNISINLEETFQNVDRLESDIQNLLELFRRIRDEGSWSVEGLEFYNVNKSLLIERKSKSTISTVDKTSKKLKEKEQRIKELEVALKDLKKDDSLLLKDPGYAALKQSMLDMRDALTAEVADKHDMILALRRDVQLLEDQCRKADQQTHFKDDIIKELRKEIKQLKQDKEDDVSEKYLNLEKENNELNKEIEELRQEIEDLHKENDDLHKENKDLHEAVENATATLKCLECKTEKYLREKENLEVTTTESFYRIKCLENERLKLQYEVEVLNMKCEDTGNRLKLQHDVEVLNLKCNCQDTENREKLACFERTCTAQVTIIEELKEELGRVMTENQETITQLIREKECLEVNCNKHQVRTIGVQPITIQTECKYVNTSPTSFRTKRRKCTCPQKDATSIDTDSDFSDSIQDCVQILKPALAKSRSRSNSPDTIKKPKSVVINETVMLEDAVSGLKESVSRLIVNDGKNKQAKKRIAELEHELEKINKKDEIIDIQNDTLNIVENELQAWRTKDSEVEAARCCREREICNLKQVIDNLVKNLDCEKQRSDNLQKAVDLYLNSISVLQESEEHFKKEISEQKVTISNLQDALVATKHTLEESQQKANTDYNQYLKLVDKLRDENLLLEVDLFYTSQDIEIYESRVLKYQQICRHLECQCASFKQEMNILEKQRDQHSCFVDELSEQLADCQDELKQLFKVLNEEQNIMDNESKNLTNHILALQIELGEISQKLSEALENLEHERQNNFCLKEEISKKDCQLSCLKQENTLVHNRLLGYEQSILTLEHESEDCQKSVALCFENLRAAEDRLAQRTKEYEMLCAKCADEADNADKLQMELQNCNKYYKDEITRYQQNMVNLEDQLHDKDVTFNNEIANYVATITVLEDKNKSAECKYQQLINHTSCNEAKIQQEYSQKECQYQQQINTCKNEQERLIAVVTKLEDRLAMLDCELLQKDKMLDTIKKNMLSLQNSNMQQAQIHQVEICSLKNEINNLIQQQSFVKSENEQLQTQLSKFHCIVSKNDEKNKLMIQELQQCLNELHIIQGDKAFLIEKNEQLIHEIQALQDTCQMKTESVVTLEMELSDTKCLKDSLCNESRNVINNVKAWLQEQRTINVELSNKLKKKNLLINKLTEENKQLKYKGSGSANVHFSNHDSYLTCESSPVPYNCRDERSREGLWSLGSVESPGFSSDSEWETNDNQTEDTPEVFIHRVESLTQELHKSNRYWKSKMNEHEYIVSKDK